MGWLDFRAIVKSQLTAGAKAEPDWGRGCALRWSLAGPLRGPAPGVLLLETPLLSEAALLDLFRDETGWSVIGMGSGICRGSSRRICAGVMTLRLSLASAFSVCWSWASRSCWRASAWDRACCALARSAISWARSRRSARQERTRTSATMAVSANAAVRNQKG